MIQLILASQSPQRKAMMDTLGLPYSILPADIDELAITAPTQFERAALVAKGKGQKIRQTLLEQKQAQRFVVMAADTYVVDPSTNRALEKPTSIDEAREMLAYQSGKTLEEYTGVYWFDSGELEVSETIATKVTFRTLSKSEIEKYITNEPVTTWSGAFCPAYDTGAALIAKIEGSFTGFTHGFPLEFFVPKLRSIGVIQ